MAAWIGPAISAVGGVLSSLFGSKKEETTSTVDYVAMRKAAEKAGFNPLTVLRSGGGAGFTTTHHPALASGQFIADALSGLGNVVASIDPMRDATAKLEHEIKQATLRNIQADTRRMLSLGGVPVSTGARKVTQASPLAVGALPGVGPLYATPLPVPAEPTVSNPAPHGSGVVTAGNVPDLETGAEARYGDFVSIPFGVANVIADVYANFRKYRPDVDKYIRPYLAPIQDQNWKQLRAPTRIPAPSGY